LLPICNQPFFRSLLDVAEPTPCPVDPMLPTRL